MDTGIDFLWAMKRIPNYPLEVWGAEYHLLVQNIWIWFGVIYLKLKNIYIIWPSSLLLIVFPTKIIEDVSKYVQISNLNKIL